MSQKYQSLKHLFFEKRAYKFSIHISFDHVINFKNNKKSFCVELCNQYFDQSHVIVDVSRVKDYITED